MNKDVIYVEPEDDITDIILKIEKSKEKIVALVPPKKAGVFRSVVNIKLIAKAGTSSGKTVVLVTIDPSIVKLAAATKIPVAKNLQTAPVIPTVEADDSVQTEHNTLIEESDGAVEAAADAEALEPSEAEKEEKSEESEEETKDEDKDDEEEEEEDDDKDEEKKPKKKPKKDSSEKSKGFGGWLKKHKKLVFVAICALGVVIFSVWAFGFAPAVDIAVTIKTEQKNFSEGISFTDNVTNENAKEGVFYLEQKKIETVQEVNFEATGKKNKGEKATGEVIVVGTVSYKGGTKTIKTGDIFTNDGLSYTADTSVTMRYDGDDDSVCKNLDGKITHEEFKAQGCRIYAKVKVTAVSAGEEYNISARENGWNTTADVSVYSESPMTGGSDDVITVVQQSDVLKAESELTVANEEENKTKLYSTIDGKYYIFDATFEQSTSSTVATPGVDEEVKAGVQPSIRTTTIATVYAIEKAKLEEFINAKADLGENQKVFAIKDMYMEKISQIANGATGKLKAQYYVGPKITETEVVERILGRGLGDAQREIRDNYGVSDVKIDKSYPWVMAVPSDSNKVSVRFEIKDQNGNDVIVQEEPEESGETEKSGDENSSDSEESEKKEQ